MKEIIPYLLIGALVPLFAVAGPSDGGGGGAFVCRTKNGKIKRHGVELLDLWEGRNNDLPWSSQVKKLNIPYTNEPVDFQINRAMKRLSLIDPALYQKVLQDLDYIKSNQMELNKNRIIYPPADALNTYGKPGCPLEGMMNYDGYLQKLVVDKLRFNELQDNTNIAASLTHEAIYKTYRDLNVIIALHDSTPARRLNACLFSTEDCVGFKENKLAPPAHQGMLKCHGDLVDFYVYGQSRTKDSYTIDYLFTRVGRFNYTSAPITREKTYGFVKNENYIYVSSWEPAKWRNPLLNSELAAYYRPVTEEAEGPNLMPTQSYVDILLGKKAPSSERLVLPALRITATGEIVPSSNVTCEYAN